MKKIMLILLISFFINNLSYSQLDTIMELCTKHMVSPYISDGQQYKALLNNDEIAEFHSTFYGGSTYRIVGYSGTSEGNLIFSLYDSDRNLLFSNKDYENAPYWDFEFKSTVDCIIEAKLNSKNLISGFAIMLIGFKQ
ncbi:MAG: hypothetical protein KAT68_08965 [Bacteroidales bacterium]|nr:hypothetical protein [Bacteroidales bacterium]